MKKVRKIQMLMGVILSVLVVLIVASIFLFRFNGKKDSKQVSSTVSVKDSRSQAKSDKDTKVKEEEIHKLKDQLTDLDTKITEAEAIVDKLKEETALPKLDIEALRNNDLSSLKGTWRTASGNEYVINESGEVRSSWISNGQKSEAIIELDNSHSHLKNRTSDSRFRDVETVSAHVKNEIVGGFIVVAVPSGVVMQAGDGGKLTDKTNYNEERLFAGQQYEAMLSRPEDVYYRVKPDTSKLEEEEKNLAQLQAEREAIKTSLESKEKKNTN